MRIFAFRSFLLISVSIGLGACSHETEISTVSPSPSYRLQAQQGAVAVTTPGYVSRYQRQAIVTGGIDTPSSPCAENFDGIMDHLETLMAPQIAENNRIAAAQSLNPAYKF